MQWCEWKPGYALEVAQKEGISQDDGTYKHDANI